MLLTLSKKHCMNHLMVYRLEYMSFFSYENTQHTINYVTTYILLQTVSIKQNYTLLQQEYSNTGYSLMLLYSVSRKKRPKGFL